MGRRRKKPRLVQPIEVVTTELGRDGRAVASFEDRTVLIDGALADERVLVQLTGRRRGRDEGKVVEVLEASSFRVEPRCEHFGTCAGCSLQHMDPQAALRHKQSQVLADLEAEGVVPGRLLAPLVGDAYGYRRRARLGAKWVEKKDKVLVGFREKDKRFVADLCGCDILAGEAGRLLTPIGTLIESLELRERVPQVEVTVADDAIALVFRVLEELGPGDAERLRAFGRAHRTRIYVQPGGLDTVAPIDGRDPHLSYRLPAHDLELRFLPTDFLQVNGGLNRAMVDLTLDKLAPSGATRVLDLFCGLGNFTLPIARVAHEVLGVEGDTSLVARARDNAARNGIANAQFECADLYGDCDGASWWERSWDAVLLDPPRSGAEKLLAPLARSRPARLVYVSCGPAAFVRDASWLVREGGFELAEFGVMDMFPQTTHVETIALFLPSRAG